VVSNWSFVPEGGPLTDGSLSRSRSRSPLLLLDRDGIGSPLAIAAFSFLLLLASAFLRDFATRSLWQAMHQIPCDVLANTSSSIFCVHERQRKQSAW